MSLKTALYEKHEKLGAKFAPFAGYDMPIQYTSVKEEVSAVRENVGVFDVSHMGEFFVKGPDAIKYVDYMVTNDIAAAELKKAIYSPLCRDNGTVIDDLIVYKLEAEKVMICVNAANIKKDWDWFDSHKDGFNIELTDHSDDYSLLAVQGPKTVETLKSLSALNADFDKLPYYAADYAKYDGEEIIVARTGYTGEDGFEIFCSHETVAKVWDALMEKDVAPCGLASRDVLRIEVGYPLYGHEINDEVTPLDSGLKWTVKFNKENFIGKAALEEHTPNYRLVKLSLEKGIPRQEYEITDSSENKIGIVTSGTMSVTINKGIALCHIKKELFPKDEKFIINIRNRKFEAQLHKKPFVTGGHK